MSYPLFSLVCLSLETVPCGKPGELKELQFFLFFSTFSIGGRKAIERSANPALGCLNTLLPLQGLGS